MHFFKINVILFLNKSLIILSMKSKKRIDEQTRLHALKIFRGLYGKMTNQQIAVKLGISLRRVYQMRKEYNQTGSIQLTTTNMHTPVFQSQKNEQNNAIKHIIAQHPTATLNEIGQYMLAAGYFICNSTLSYRLEQLELQGQKQNQADTVVQQFNMFKREKEKNKSNAQEQLQKKLKRMTQLQLIQFAVHYQILSKKVMKVCTLARREIQLRKNKINTTLGKNQHIKHQ